ncbi:MAG: amino acid permease [Acidimicrobiales bacterium]
MSQDLARHEEDVADLATHGYRQKLNRRLGSFSSFAAGFSYISILTGMFELFGFGYGFGGPAMWFAWLLVFAGQMAVALVFAELAARYPIAGSVYQWVKNLSSPATAWMTGWIMLVGSIVTVSAVAVALQIVLPTVWSGFEVFSNPTSNAVFLGCCIIAVTTIINAIGVRLMAIINNIGVCCELAGATLLIILLLAHATRGPGVVASTQGVGPGLPGFHALGYFAAFIMGAIMPAYVMYGFDTACSLAEETRDPRRRAPRAILQALGVAGVAGALLLLFALMAAKSLSPATLGVGGLPSIVIGTLGNTLGRILLADVAIAISVCTLAIQTATIRMTFAMARDNNLPFGRTLSRVSDHNKSPVVPAIVSGVIAAAILFLYIGKTQLFLSVTSVAIILIYIPYFMSTIPVLLKRFRGEWPAAGEREGLFSMGRYGMAVNLFAVVYGVAMAVNLAIPRSQVYGSGAYSYVAIIVVVAVVGIGLIYYYGRQRHQTGVLEDHRAEETPVPIHAGGGPVGP